MSLRQLYPDPKAKGGSNAVQVDIIAVHGLNPRSENDEDHAWDTWRKPKGSKGRLWLRDDLPKRLPNARIFLYVYNSTAVFGSDRGTFMDKANELLERIRTKRDDAKDRPLVLLGHSLGGLLIEQALVNAHNNQKYTHIRDATTGLAFFGTPHYGGNKFLLDMGGVAAKIARGLGFQKGDDILETLKDGSIFTDTLQEHWRHQLLRFDIVSFFGSMDNVVSRESARFGLPGEREHIVKINADHSGICCFDESQIDQDNFEFVEFNVKDLYDKALKSEQGKRAKQDLDITEAIKKWLPSCDFEGKHNDIFLSCFKFLGRWLLEDEVFRSWAIGGRPWYFRLFGKEGTGKTVLSSIVINYLQEDIETKKNPVIYLYLDETDPTTHVLENLFGSLLRQLLDRKPFTATSELQKFYRKGEAKANHWREICGLLKTEILTYDRVYLIVDGLYECQQTQVRTKLERQLVELHKLHSTQLCLMITMRMTRELRENILFCDKCGRQGLRIYFTCSICKVDLCQICRDKGITCDDKSHPMSEPYTAIEVELELRDCDIEQYIRHRIDDNGPELWDKRISTDHPNATVLGRECRRDPKYLQTIVSRITNKAEGILLSAKLYMDQLMCAKNRKDINTILDSLSSGLDKSYAAAMLRIQNQEELENQEIGFHVLALVSQARRPLGLEELLHVLATEPGDRDFDQDKSYDKRLILSATNGLINISDYDKIVRVHHSSLYLYLAKTLDKWFPNVKTDIAKKCLTYLNWDAFSKPPQDYMEFNSREQSYPFIAYASQYWGDHVREAGPDSSIDEMVARFLDDPSRVTAIIQAALYSISWGIDAWDVWKGVTDLHVCAWYGLFSVLSARLEKGTRLQIDVRESTYMQTPLMYACRRGQVEVARQLLDRGADINLVSSRGRTALLEAVIQDQTEVVEMLLERQNLNINAVNTKEHNRTALMLAACLGQSEIVDSLLTHGAQPNLQDEDGYTALWLAVNAQEEDTVKVLLENSKVDGRIDIDLADRIGRTPFIVAAMKNNCDIVELLHKHHANPSIKDKQGRGNAIIRAIDHRSKNVVEWMLDHLEEAVIQCSDDDGRGVLHAASFSGNTDMVDLLAEDERIDINKQDNYGRTPLHAASEEGHLKIVETLIDYDADVAIKDDFDRTPLTIATQYGRTEIASLLLGKDEDQQSNPHHTVNTETSPIWLLVKIGRADLVLQSITKRKGDFSEKEPVSNNTALHCAVLYNRVDLLRILLNNIDSGPNPIDRNKRTPLHQAAVNGFLECTTVLLNHGADVNVEDKWQCTPLHLARSSSRQRDEHLRVAVTLIEAGADTKPTEIQEMFFAAVELGRIAAVQILMDRGADVLGRDDEDKTAYEYARDAGNIEMMKILQPKISRGSEVESGTSGRRVHRVRARKKILSSERVGQAGKEAQEIEGS